MLGVVFNRMCCRTLIKLNGMKNRGKNAEKGVHK